MKIPKQIKIGSHYYKVLLKNISDKESSNYSGYCKPTDNIIVVNDTLPKSQQDSTLLHEIIEAINFAYELKLEHSQIMTLETSLYQVLHDNKLKF